MKVKMFGKLITKVTRRPNESKQDCINRGVTLLIGEGMKPNQARAVAEQQCDLRRKEKVSKSFWSNLLGISKS